MKPSALSLTDPRIRNPLIGLSKEQLFADVDAFAEEAQLQDQLPLLRKAALAAQSPQAVDDIAELDEGEKLAFREEVTHRWKHPRTLYFTIFLNSIAAAIQGWDQTGSNGANLSAWDALGIPDTGPVCEAAGNCEKNSWLVGLVNSVPYIAICLL
jgi:hypothetical protein